ncbi:hypothetical protein, partial [Thiolapillus sp.]|uniref:hypothetical protein n=1 Tax=Thiolapillus sp. TaxID=2017437 RepID=UPI003AF89E81
RILEKGLSGPDEEPDRGLRLWFDALGEGTHSILESAILQPKQLTTLIEIGSGIKQHAVQTLWVRISSSIQFPKSLYSLALKKQPVYLATTT